VWSLLAMNVTRQARVLSETLWLTVEGFLDAEFAQEEAQPLYHLLLSGCGVQWDLEPLPGAEEVERGCAHGRAHPNCRGSIVPDPGSSSSLLKPFIPF
jgi:hypothetical protein